MLELVSAGAFPSDQSGDQTAHAAGFARLLPTFVSVSQGKPADVRVLDELVLEPGSFYGMDRGCLDFQRLSGFVLAAAFCVTRSKTHLKFNRLASRPVDPTTGVRRDQIVWLRNPPSLKHYPDKLRRIHYADRARGKRLVFLTNNFGLPALTSLARQEPLAGGIILQTDQAAPAHQTFLRHQWQRCEDADLDFHLRLRVSRDCEKTTPVRTKPPPRFAGFERERA